MNERDVSEAWVAWIGAVTGIATAAQYAYPVANVLAEPPIVAGVVDRKRTVWARDEEAGLLFPQLQIQQVQFIRLFEVSATILIEAEPEQVAAEAAEDAARDSFRQLQAWGEALELSAWADDSLEQRLGADENAGFISPALAFDYTPVYRELDDGTRGRTFVIEARIGEVIDLEPE